MQEQVNVKIEKTSDLMQLPTYTTQGAAGMDLYSANPKPVELKPLERTLIPLGFKMELPQGYEAQIRARSGLSIKHGITLVNAIGTIDEDYRGEVCVPVINLSSETYTINTGERIAQMVIAPVTKAQLQLSCELAGTSRGAGGFGSTGY